MTLLQHSSGPFEPHNVFVIQRNDRGGPGLFPGHRLLHFDFDRVGLVDELETSLATVRGGLSTNLVDFLSVTLGVDGGLARPGSSQATRSQVAGLVRRYLLEPLEWMVREGGGEGRGGVDLLGLAGEGDDRPQRLVEFQERFSSGAVASDWGDWDEKGAVGVRQICPADWSAGGVLFRRAERLSAAAAFLVEALELEVGV